MKKKVPAPKKAEAKASKKPASKKTAVIDNAAEEPVVEQPQEEAITEVVEAGEQVSTRSKGRDNSTLTYASTAFKKGPLVRRVISDHVAVSKGKMTYKQLKEAFPD